jgi:hypothetical protein
MSQHSTGVLIAELLETFLAEVEESLDAKRTREATQKVRALRMKINGFVVRNDRVLSLREALVAQAANKRQ